MTIYHVVSLIITLTVIIGYINYRFVRLQSSIGTMVGALVLSIIIVVLEHSGFSFIGLYIKGILDHLHFNKILLQGMLSVLLFAGALTIDVPNLTSFKWEILTLSSFSTIFSSLSMGVLSFFVFHLAGIYAPLLICFLFGALISPTDPIAVLATFKGTRSAKGTDVIITGESLFNDGFAIIIFSIFFNLIFEGVAPTLGGVLGVFFYDVIGGIIYGAILGWINYHFIKAIKDSKLAIFITLATVTGGYAISDMLLLSGPLAMVSAGLFLGYKGKKSEITPEIHKEILRFWDIADEILNSILFLLIGFEILLIKFSAAFLVATAVIIPLLLFIRFLSVCIPMHCFKFKKSYAKFIILILTWGGIRGGVPIALALNIPESPFRNLIIAITYGIVAVSMLVQASTVKPIIQYSEKHSSDLSKK